MKLKEIENKYSKIEVEILKKEKERDNLSIEVATLEAQVKVKNSKFFDLDEEIADLREEKRKLEITREVILTPAQSESGEEELEPKKYDPYQPEHNYNKGDRFKESNRIYEVIYNHKSDKTFNKLYTNKYQLIDEDGKPIFNYSVLKTYNKFEKCLSDDHIYSSKIDKNGTSPINNPENWIKVD